MTDQIRQYRSLNGFQFTLQFLERCADTYAGRAGAATGESL